MKDFAMRLLIICAALLSALFAAAAHEEDGVMLKLRALNREYNDALGESTLLVDDYATLAAGVMQYIDSYYDCCGLSREIKPDNLTFLKVSGAYIFVNNLIEQEKLIGDINARIRQLTSLYDAIQALYAEIR